MIVYDKLRRLLRERGMKYIDLKAVVSGPTLAKMSKGESVTTTTLAKICTYLDCQPGDIMDNIPSPSDEVIPLGTPHADQEQLL